MGLRRRGRPGATGSEAREAESADTEDACAGQALHAPAVKQRLDNLGAAVMGTTGPEFDKFIQAEYQKWGPIIKAAGIKGN